MKLVHRVALLAAIPALFSLPALAGPPEGGDDTVAAEGEVSEEEALEDDILLTINLPLAVEEAREVGVIEAELTGVLAISVDAGLSAGEVTEVIEAETEVTKENGPRENLGAFVRRQVADGVHGKELAAAIKEKKDELKELSEEEKAELDAKLKELKEGHKAHRKAVHAKRMELKKAGKEVKHRKDKHERYAKLLAEWKTAKKEGREARADDNAGGSEVAEGHKEGAELNKEAADLHKEGKHDEAKAKHQEAKEAHKDAKEAHKEGKGDNGKSAKADDAKGDKGKGDKAAKGDKGKADKAKADDAKGKGKAK